MKYLFITFSYLFSFSLLADAPDYKALEAMLDLDRFEAYTEAWAATMRGRGKAPIADAIHKFTPADFKAMNLDPAKLKNASHYDGLILQVLTHKHPELGAKAADVEWGYNFFKNKLNEAYTVDQVKERKTTPDPVPVTEARRQPVPLEMESLNSSEVLLDVDAYASDRTTRAVFWEASDSRREIELFVGSASHFLDEMTRRGARIVGEVGTKARNYNPIYLIQNPGEAGYHYAITEISGADRLKHFQLQSSLIRWQRANGALAPAPSVSVVGNAVATLREEERALSSVLRNVPRADHIVIGQKGAFERTFGSLGKIQAIIALKKADPAKVTQLFSEKELKLVAKAEEAGSALTQFVMKYASDIDKLYQTATPTLTAKNLLAQPFTAFNYDRGTYEMSDFVVNGADGKPQRWRIFSNVWGDEVLPIARALKATGYNSVNYIGTAGAFQNTGLQVGDLVVPKSAATITGELTLLPRASAVLPPGAKVVDAVVNVQTPFEETRDWLGRAERVSQVVEVETGYLSSVFNAPTDNLNVQLLISDVVGSESETLATASSSARRKAQISAISEIVQSAGVVSTGTVAQTDNVLMRWVQEIVPNRDPASMVQIVREAQLQGIESREALETFIKSQKSFTTAKAESMLRTADAHIAKLVAAFRKAGVNPVISFSEKLFDGRFNPSAGPVEIHLTGTPEAVERIQAIAGEVTLQTPDMKKSLSYNISASTPPGFVTQGSAGDVVPGVRVTYQNGIIQYGGLAHTENASGAMKFVKVGEVSRAALDVDSAYQISTLSVCATRNISEVIDDLLK